MQFFSPPKYIKENLAQCIATQLFSSLPDSQKLDIVVRNSYLINRSDNKLINFVVLIHHLFYSESKLSNSKRDGSDGNIYKRIPASGLIEDRLKYIRRKHEVKSRSKSLHVESSEVLGSANY